MNPNDCYSQIHGECLELLGTLRDLLYAAPGDESNWDDVVDINLIKAYLTDVVDALRGGCDE